MTDSEIESLSRAHQLFAGSTRPPPLDPPVVSTPILNGIVGQDNYRSMVNRSHQVLLSAARTDAAAAGVIAGAHHDRAEARELTKNILDEARADVAVTPITPMAQREAMRRRAARLRTQRAHVLAARLRARRHSAALRALRYRMLHHRGPRLPAPSSRAGIAVRAALSRLGRPYVWGATGPDQFDCSGLVQWSYARAGIHLDRTTYQQINDGIPVPRSQVRPGDLVFPHTGHVQMAIGNNLVVEAPYSGASVRISRLGNYVAIRRPI
ncbi:C40 family peptidase [Mycobacterium sp. Aquia_213]|uniref:C40 family peptidase n=1 Tax=Mycobacterium sp. Aquia_213 TaxID=2991728 RepID=UPI002271F8DE|nr:C40 family peptidase [Mycobacterium sp. Aquia_213]WAC91633.1 C40 family peptidase [Mycobacterium sp. Aquia_213]